MQRDVWTQKHNDERLWLRHFAQVAAVKAGLVFTPQQLDEAMNGRGAELKL